MKKKSRNSQRILPHVFAGDDAFGLKPHMMKPYPSQNLPIDWIGLDWNALFHVDKIVEKKIKLMNA